MVTQVWAASIERKLCSTLTSLRSYSIEKASDQVLL